MSVVRLSSLFENFHIFRLGQCENTFKYVRPAYCCARRYKCRKKVDRINYLSRKNGMRTAKLIPRRRIKVFKVVKVLKDFNTIGTLSANFTST